VSFVVVGVDLGRGRRYGGGGENLQATGL